MIGYKLFRIRKDGTIGSLFINTKIRIPSDEWMEAESHPTKGFALRPFWHVTSQPVAPHLSVKGRVWRQVEVKDFEIFKRPQSQGGVWMLAKWIKVLSGPVQLEVPNEVLLAA